MKPLFICAFLLAAEAAGGWQEEAPSGGFASWYGEELRGWPMANGKPFNPDALTAASWFYPLGTRVRVVLRRAELSRRSVEVVITDRGPALTLVRQGRIIDLSRAAFEKVGRLESGLVPVTVERLETAGAR